MSYAAIYEKKTGAGMYRVYTTNSDAFKVYLAEISPSGDELPMKKKDQGPRNIILCDHCCQPIKGEIIPAPIYMEERDGMTVWSENILLDMDAAPLH